MDKTCVVCGHTIPLDKKDVYTVVERKGFVTSISNPAQYFDAIDCPVCGCQNALAIRLPKRKETENAEDAADED